MFNIQIKIHLRLKKADEYEKKLFIQKNYRQNFII